MINPCAVNATVETGFTFTDYETLPYALKPVNLPENYCPGTTSVPPEWFTAEFFAQYLLASLATESVPGSGTFDVTIDSGVPPADIQFKSQLTPDFLLIFGWSPGSYEMVYD